MSRTSTSDSPFRQQLVAALEHFEDPEWLGERSPLATPYFLGEHLSRRPYNSTAVGRGQALRRLIRETAQTLAQQDQEGKHYYNLLALSFFRSQTILRICQELNTSRATYYRHRAKAIARLEEALIQRLKPALRLEEPPAFRQEMVGRQDVFSRCLQAIRRKQTAAITGNGGVGKTTLGAQLARSLKPQPTFWFTLRPGLNDQLTSLLFSLGYFLQQHDRSNLWAQLVAGKGEGGDKVVDEPLLELVRHSLKEFSSLLCFDDIDLLRPAEIERHARILSFLESLQGVTSLLLMGQHMPVAADQLEPLDGLTLPETAQMLAEADVQLSQPELVALHNYTRGNPRLLVLFVALHRSGEPLKEVLPRVSTSPSVEFLLNRIQQRLTAEEQDLLAALSVFRRPVPSDAWQDRVALDILRLRCLVQFNEQGQVTLLPAFRSIIYRRLAPENREAFHLKAAAVRAERGEYTSAAYHYIGGGQAQIAVSLWYRHRQQEINQGQGSTALQLFERLSANQLDEPSRELLILLRSELRMLVGDYDAIRKDLHTILWPESLLKGRAKRLEGDVAYERSQFDSAIHTYMEGLETVEVVGQELALLHKEMGKAYAHKRDFEAAWHQTLLAEYEVDNLKGSIQNDIGNFAKARHHYEKALRLAQELGHIEGEGKTRNNLAWLLRQLGEFEAANEHWQKASECYEQVGRLTWQAGIKINQAVGYTETGRPQAAVPLLEEALAFFESVDHARGRALARFNLAEAHLALGNLDDADNFAWRAIQDEEPVVMAASFHTLAEIRLAQKRLAEAEVFCRKAIQFADEHRDLLNCGQSWRTLGKVYLVQGKSDEAAAALDKALEMFDDLALPQEVEATQAIYRDVPGREC